MIEWENIEYLKGGDEVQKKSYAILTKLHIMELLKPYRPILVGTIPIGIYTETSDLDIICQALDLIKFQKLIQKKFQLLPGFHLECSENIVVSNFNYEGMQIELYASKKDPKLQNGYRHMVLEHRILSLDDGTLKKNVIELKKSGIKTEPAFASLLGLTKDPYEQLLCLEEWEDEKIRKQMKISNKIQRRSYEGKGTHYTGSTE